MTTTTPTPTTMTTDNGRINRSLVCDDERSLYCVPFVLVCCVLCSSSVIVVVLVVVDVSVAVVVVLLYALCARLRQYATQRMFA